MNILTSSESSNFVNMRGIMIKKVETKEDMEDFINLSYNLYKDCPYYVPDLEMDIRSTFNPLKNAGLDFSDIQAFLAFNEQGKLVGRIASIINHRANEKWNTRNVRFGFFDFINDLTVSTALLDAVIQWGKERGMNSIQGPMGITDFDKEGMLIEDFDQMGSMNTLYNYSYYPKHMEALGYEKEVDWIQIRINIPKETPAKYARVARLSKEMFDIKVKKINNRDITRGGYGQKIFHLLNKSYSSIFGFTEFTDRQIEDFVKQYLGLIDKRLVTVVENEKDEVIGVAVSMCSLSDALRKSKGKLFPFGWFHLLKALKWRPEKHADLLLIAVRPDYQMLGVNALFFDDLIPIYNKQGILWAETGPQLEDNMRELTQWKPLNPTFTKRRRCYKKKI